MAVAVPVIQIGAAIIGAAAAAKGAIDAKKAGKENAARVKAESEEQVRRTRIEQQKTEALARARAAASGAQGGSVDVYMAGLQSEHQKELQWLGKSASMNASSAIQQGNTGFASGLGTAAGYAGTALSTAAAQKSWWS